MARGCPSCGREVDASVTKCPYCGYDFKQLNELFQRYEAEKQIHVPKYAGFVKRLVATLFDLLILALITGVIFGVYSYIYLIDKTGLNLLEQLWAVLDSFKTLLNPDYVLSRLGFIVLGIYTLVYFLYCTFRQCSKRMGTIGEKLVGIEVVDDLEAPITFGLSFKRNFLRLLNLLTLEIGFLITPFMPKKQALNDLIAKTYVLNRITDEDYGNFIYANGFVRLMALAFDVLFLALLAYGFNYGYEWLNGLELKEEFLMYFDIALKLLGILMLLILVFYFPYMESKKGRTLGKLIFKIEIKTIYDEKMNFMKALIRGILNIFDVLCLGCLLAFVTPRKQTLKDIMTGSIVVKH